MSALSIQPTYPIFTDIDGQPLEAGYVWLGTANLDPQVNPIAVFSDAALTIPAVQPVRTLGGYPSNSGTPVRLYVNSGYSIRVMNKNGSVVYSAPSATERYNSDVITSVNVNSEDVIYEPAGLDAVETNAQTKLRNVVDVTDFMTAAEIADAKLSVPTLSVHEAVQRAVDYCLTFDPPALLTVSVLCRLDQSVFIDREVDGPNSSTYFIIQGDGISGGFYAYVGVNMFSTTLTTGNPNSLAASQKVNFDKIVFKSEFPSNPVWVLDDAKFLRMKFTNCSFHRIKLAQATRYLQTYYFNNCMAYGWLATFFGGTNGAYDIKFDNFVAEAGTAFYSVVCNDVYSGDPNAQISITNSLFQSISGAVVNADRAQGFVVENCYFEGNGSNGAPNLKFDTPRNLANLTPNGSITVKGNFFSELLANFDNPSYYGVRWGRVTQSGFAAGNYLVDLQSGSPLKLHYTIPETRVVFANEPGWPYPLYVNEFIFAESGYVMPNGGERITIIRGTVNANGTIAGGAGFTVTKTGTGTYTINYTVAFSAAPSASITLADFTGTPFCVAASSVAGSSSLVARTPAGVTTDCSFSFITVGPV